MVSNLSTLCNVSIMPNSLHISTGGPLTGYTGLSLCLSYSCFSSPHGSIQGMLFSLAFFFSPALANTFPPGLARRWRRPELGQSITEIRCCDAFSSAPLTLRFLSLPSSWRCTPCWPCNSVMGKISCPSTGPLGRCCRSAHS